MRRLGRVFGGGCRRWFTGGVSNDGGGLGMGPPMPRRARPPQPSIPAPFDHPPDHYGPPHGFHPAATGAGPPPPRKPKPAGPRRRRKRRPLPKGRTPWVFVRWALGRSGSGVETLQLLLPFQRPLSDAQLALVIAQGSFNRVRNAPRPSDFAAAREDALDTFAAAKKLNDSVGGKAAAALAAVLANPGGTGRDIQGAFEVAVKHRGAIQDAFGGGTPLWLTEALLYAASLEAEKAPVGSDAALYLANASSDFLTSVQAEGLGSAGTAEEGMAKGGLGLVSPAACRSAVLCATSPEIALLRLAEYVPPGHKADVTGHNAVLAVCARHGAWAEVEGELGRMGEGGVVGDADTALLTAAAALHPQVGMGEGTKAVEEAARMLITTATRLGGSSGAELFIAALRLCRQHRGEGVERLESMLLQPACRIADEGQSMPLRRIIAALKARDADRG
eukprot:Hpha_TRINITY_DN31137_c0_g1::TRINITY_DN31137_c0_g1_i1::g.33078::m.33078